MPFNETFRIDAMKPMAPSMSDLTHTFILSPTPNSKQALAEVPKALGVDLHRHRRVHQKSKAGCQNCKRRRVKCTEETPCASCVRRDETCKRLMRSQRPPSIPPTPTQTTTLGSQAADPIVNLDHLKLFHHFQTCTRHTLLMPSDVWEFALQLCFDFDFLMNAILCVAARHLSALLPHDTTYPIVAAKHLGRVLSRFRQALSDDSTLTTTNFDAFIVTSSLIQYEIWASADYILLHDDGNSLTPPRDPMFEFSSGLKQVFLKSVRLNPEKLPVLMPQVQHNPLHALVQNAKISSKTLEEYQDYFCYRRPLNIDLSKIPVPFMRRGGRPVSDPWASRSHNMLDEVDPIQDGYKPAISRLCLILSFLPEAQPDDAPDATQTVQSELARYVFSFPVQCYGHFASMLQSGDPHAALLVCHFYRAVRILLHPDKYWWACKRATTLEATLQKWLANYSNSIGTTAP